MRSSRVLLLAIIAFVALCGTASATVTNVEMDVFPDGGSLDPQDRDQAGGWIDGISNPGSVTITNHATGSTLFSQPLSWGCADVSPDGSCDEPPHDVWSFDFLKQPPSIYDVCGTIAAGDGFAGWSQCQSYAVDLPRLFTFGRGTAKTGHLAVPLRAVPALQGQQVTVTATWFKARLVATMGGSSFPGASTCRSCAKLAWVRERTETQQLTLGAWQALRFSRPLGLNTKVEINLDFPGIAGATDSEASAPTDPWLVAGGCTLDLHGQVHIRWKRLKPDLKGPRLEDQTVTCSAEYQSGPDPAAG
jgi:hypothetical protein